MPTTRPTRTRRGRQPAATPAATPARRGRTKKQQPAQSSSSYHTAYSGVTFGGQPVASFSKISNPALQHAIKKEYKRRIEQHNEEVQSKYRGEIQSLKDKLDEEYRLRGLDAKTHAEKEKVLKDYIKKLKARGTSRSSIKTKVISLAKVIGIAGTLITLATVMAENGHIVEIDSLPMRPPMDG